MTIDRIGRKVVTPEPAAVSGVSMRRSFTSLFRVLFAFALLAPISMLTTSPVSAATTIAPTTTCGNALGIDLAGRGLICEVTVVNTITASGGSAVVTVRECFGSAGAPTDGSGIGGFGCTNPTSSLTKPVTAVTQCNGSINGGGSTLRCSVKVTNNFVGLEPGATAATVNQCIGSGAGGIVGANIHCDPVQATTSAAVTQCNGSANGLTLTSPVGLTCTVTGTMSSALPVTINQCNGSTNGGGALIICSASLTNAVITAAASASAGAGASASAGAGAGVTPSPTSTVSDNSSNNSTLPLLPLLLMGFAGTALAIFVAHRRIIRS
jgi:hypothetical protein